MEAQTYFYIFSLAVLPHITLPFDALSLAGDQDAIKKESLLRVGKRQTDFRIFSPSLFYKHTFLTAGWFFLPPETVKMGKAH